MLVAVPKNATRLVIGQYIGFVPETWDDLPLEKLMNIVAILVLSKWEDLDASETIFYQRLNILAVLMNTDLDLLLKEFNLGTLADKLTEEETYEANDLLNQTLATISFCYETPDEDKPEELRVNLGLTRCPYPQLTTGQGITLYAPANGLDNITIYELANVLNLTDAYTAEPTDANLCQLLATVYRPGKLVTPQNTASDFNGDRRQRLYNNDHLVAARARRFRTLPHIVKQTLWFWLASCRQAIVNNPSFAILFERGPEGAGKEDPFGWAGTLLHLADDKVMNMEAAANAPYASALLQLAREKYQAQEEKMNARRRR